MTSSPFHAAVSTVPHTGGLGWTRWALAAATVVAGGIGVLYLAWPDWHKVHAEGGVLEMAQLAMLAAAAASAALGAVGQRGRDRLWCAWLMVIFALGIARELDLQEQLNEEVLGAWAVSYKIEWWLSFDVPLHLKLMWGGAFGLVGVGLVVPLLVVRPPAVRLLRRGDAGTWLLAAGVIFYGMGYVTDDILGRGVVFSKLSGQVVEEISELFGAAGLLAGGVLAAKRPLSARARAVENPGAAEADDARADRTGAG